MLNFTLTDVVVMIDWVLSVCLIHRFLSNHSHRLLFYCVLSVCQCAQCACFYVHCYAKNKVQPIVTMFCGLGACVYVCCLHSRAVLKRLNRLKSHVGTKFVGAQISQGKSHFQGLHCLAHHCCRLPVLFCRPDVSENCTLFLVVFGSACNKWFLGPI